MNIKTKMNKQQIFELVSKVFQGFEPCILDKNTWSKIKIDDGLDVYTYSGSPDKSSVWYFNTFWNGQSQETEISNINTEEFVRIYFEIYKDIVKNRELSKSISERLKEIDTKQTIRDVRIRMICNE